MSQKAWMNAYTKGSKSLQARLAKIHANNPEFQDFVKKHGFGGNLSVKQSGMQKKSSVGTVKPVTEPSPEKNQNMDREALIKAAAEKLRNRRMANANRVAFGGELGGGFALHNVGFRRYTEEWNKTSTERGIKPGERDTETFERDKKILAYRKPNPYLNRPSFASGMKKGKAKLQGEELSPAERSAVDKSYPSSKAGQTRKGAKYRSVFAGKPDMLAHKEYMLRHHPKQGEEKFLNKQSLSALKAQKKPNLPEETINELSKDRLKWYVKHALRDMNHLDDASMGTQDPLWKKSVKRAQNISKAKRKMSEETINEGIPFPGQNWDQHAKITKPSHHRKEAEWHEKQARKYNAKSNTSKADQHSNWASAHRQYYDYLKDGGLRFNLKNITEMLEDISYKDGTITMKRGGWIAKRNGKQIGVTMPTDDHAKKLIDTTRKSLAHKTIDVIMRKRQEIARGLGRMSLAAESAQNRRRVRSWDSAVMPELKPLRVKPKTNPPFDPDPPKKNLGIVVGKNDPGYSKARHLARQGLKKQMERDRVNKTIDYISNPKYSVLDKNHINTLLKGK